MRVLLNVLTVLLLLKKHGVIDFKAVMTSQSAINRNAMYEID